MEPFRLYDLSGGNKSQQVITSRPHCEFRRNSANTKLFFQTCRIVEFPLYEPTLKKKLPNYCLTRMGSLLKSNKMLQLFLSYSPAFAAAPKQRHASFLFFYLTIVEFPFDRGFSILATSESSRISLWCVKIVSRCCLLWDCQPVL